MFMFRSPPDEQELDQKNQGPRGTDAPSPVVRIDEGVNQLIGWSGAVDHLMRKRMRPRLGAFEHDVWHEQKELRSFPARDEGGALENHSVCKKDGAEQITVIDLIKRVEP